MCRLYGFRGTHPSSVECELLRAQNSLIQQSREDARGLVNDHGWGIGLVADGRPSCARQVEPASESEDFRRDAMEALASTVIAHVRRATVGEPSLRNTHPFRHGSSMLAHNGHIGPFEGVRPRMLEATRRENREAIAGTTDSEHFFQLLLSRRAERADEPLAGLLRGAIRDVERWSREASDEGEVALNVIWTVGEELVGSRSGRSLWFVERDAPHVCEVCGNPHPDPGRLPDGADYRAVVLASEPITGEEWREVPERSVFGMDGDTRLEVASIES